MSDLVPQTPKGKLPMVTGRRVTIYLSVAVAILILGLFLTPTFPDELIGEVVLIIVVTYIEIRKKINQHEKK